MRRLLISTTAIAVALSSVPPLPLLAQTTEGEACVPGEGVTCDPPAEALPEPSPLPAPVPEEVAPPVQPEAPETDAPSLFDLLPGQAPESPPAAEAEPEAPPPEVTPEAPPEAPAEVTPPVPEAPPAAPPEVTPEAEPAPAPDAPATDAPAEVPPPAPEAPPATPPEAPAPSTPEAPPATPQEAPVQPDPAPVPGTDTPPSVTPPTAETPEAAPGTAPGLPPTETAPPPADTAPPAATEDSAAAPEAAPEPQAEAMNALQSLLAPQSAPEAGTSAEPPAAAAAAADPLPGDPPAEGQAGQPAAAADPVDTIVSTITEADSRSSSEEFATTAREGETARDDDRGLSDLQKFGLVALGALAVGAVLSNGDRVVSNTGDRVVVDRGDGRFEVLKDDDTLIRRPGSTVRTQSYRDGSTRTIVERNDGTSIITIRDASGRVLRRVREGADGRQVVLIDDLTPVEPIDVTRLPSPPRQPVTISTQSSSADLQSALDAIGAREAARGYSLRQVRDIREVRALAPQIDVAPITFATGSAAIAVTEAEKLAALGEFIARTIEERPGELFLIEGHTDAVGSAASNLALSDRRAESVALALTEYFAVPPENLVVQGYGEGDLLVATDGNEPRNRRVAVRVVTPLLQASR